MHLPTHPYFFVAFQIGLAFFTSANAEIAVVDPEDQTVLETTHNGNVEIELLDLTGGSASLAIRSMLAPSIIATADFFTLSFTQGTELDPMFGVDAVPYLEQGSFTNGATNGLNYARLDLDEDGTYETVIELDLGLDTDFTDDLITRFAFQEDGSALNIPDALKALNRATEANDATIQITEIERSNDGAVTLTWKSSLPAGTPLVLRATPDPSVALVDWPLVSNSLMTVEPGMESEITPESDLLDEQKLFFVLTEMTP